MGKSETTSIPKSKCIKKIRQRENKTAEEQADEQYLSLLDTSGTRLQTLKCMQNSSWEQTGGPDQWERTYRTTQNSEGWRNWGET